MNKAWTGTLIGGLMGLVFLGPTFSEGEPEVPELQFVTIGTGAVTGVYYPAGNAIARLVNEHGSDSGVRVSVESTAGSVANITGLNDGSLQFGIVQSDRQYQAVNGLAEWSDQPQAGLRSVFGIHPEIVTLVATVSSGIDSVADLEGRRVNIGHTGSGQLQNSIDVLQAFGIDFRTDIESLQQQADQAPAMLAEGQMDAFFFTVGHPNTNITQAVSAGRAARFVPIEGPPINDLLADHPYYVQTVIPIEEYPQAANSSDVQSIGVTATLVTTAVTPNDVVYVMTKQVFENLVEFRSLHPAFSRLTKESMLQGLFAPVHPGAQRYYREAGLLPYVQQGTEQTAATNSAAPGPEPDAGR